MKKMLVVTMGDPAGIGIEIILKSRVVMKEMNFVYPFYILGDAKLFAKQAERLNFPLDVIPIKSPSQAGEVFLQGVGVLDFHHLDIPPINDVVQFGKPNSAYGKSVYLAVAKAVEHIKAGHASALVTAPISKEICQQAGFQFSGHTDYLAQLNDKKQVVMMLANEVIKAVPLTVHIPLHRVPQALTETLIIHQAQIVHDALQTQFGIKKPILAMAGLNPHAGEDGMFGDEEQKIITPALEKLRAQHIDIRGPFAGDSMFSKEMRQTYDVALACYHDQALIPVKTLDMAKGVNITLGLDFIRTSPDHGTAFDIADKLIANPQSMLAAIKMASDIVNRENHYA